MQWNHGHYERIAVDLLPAALLVVNRAALMGGERVLDVGCGTGNAALIAAERGAQVIGVDPAERLLSAARLEAANRKLGVSFLSGDAASLPVPDGSVDVALSVFGAIFAEDAVQAAKELSRVCATRARILNAAW